MKNKVLFVHDGPLFSHKGSIYGNQINNRLIDRYTELGSEVHFIMRLKEIPEDQLHKYELVDHPSFRFISIPEFKSLSTLFNKSKVRNIIKLAIDECDLVISRLPSASGVIAMKLARKAQKPVLIESVACVFDALWNYNWKGKLLAHYKLFKYKNILKNASHTIYVTNNFLQSRYPTNGKWIGCSDVVLKSLNQEVLKNRLEKIKKSISYIRLLTVAAIDVKYKGQADVIQALYKLKKKGVNLQYEIVGQGDPSRLNKIIKDLDMSDQVKILGPLPHDKIFSKLEQTDLYIQPSKQEGLPRAVIEALSLACPVLGANTGGIPELIHNECIYDQSIKGLSELLLKVDKNFLLRNANLNFKTAHLYQVDALNNRRSHFYNEFLEDYKLL